jgi:hypothetical protein
VAAVALVSAATAHAQAPVDVGGTFQQIEQAANAWIPTIMQEASFLFYVLATLDFALSITHNFSTDADAELNINEAS